MNTGSMTKAELVEEVSRVSDLTKKHSEVIVDTVFKSIIDALHRGEKIELRGFGSFRLRRREPRKGRNPKTGDKVDVPPKKVPYFKPGKELKELINREAEAPQAPPAPAGLPRLIPMLRPCGANASASAISAVVVSSMSSHRSADVAEASDGMWRLGITIRCPLLYGKRLRMTKQVTPRCRMSGAASASARALQKTQPPGLAPPVM